MFYYLIIDTNVLIDYKTIIELFCHDVEQAKLPIKLIIPSVVLGELDGCAISTTHDVNLTYRRHAM